MKKITLFAAFFGLFALASCTKEPLTNTAPAAGDNTQHVYDWASGQEILTITDGVNQAAGDRAPDDYLYNVVSATSTYQQKVTVYQGSTIIAVVPWQITNGVSFGISGNNENTYTFVVNYLRYNSALSVELNINWHSNCEGWSPTEKFKIPLSGVTKSHTFGICG